MSMTIKDLFSICRTPLDDEDDFPEAAETGLASEPSDEHGTHESAAGDSYEYEGQIIGFMSGKGGVGKTGLAINVANFCAENGAKVLLVDCDLNTNGATTFFRTSESTKYLFYRKANILTMHNILTSVIVENTLSDVENPPKTNPVNIKWNYDFIPASIDGGRFDEQGLCAESLPKLEDSYISEWRKNYDLIIWDFGAGAGLLNSMLSQILDKICIVMPPNDISRQAVRRQLGFLFRECNLDNLICCVNMQTAQRQAANSSALFNEFSGFPSSTGYAQLYDAGVMIEISDNYLCSYLSVVVKNVFDNSDGVLNAYYEKINLENREPLISPEEAKEKAEKRSLRQLLMIIFMFSLLLCISFLTILSLKAWEKIPVWGYIIFTVGVTAFGVCIMYAIHKLTTME